MEFSKVKKEYIEREAAIAETRKPRLTDAELRRRLAYIPTADVRENVHAYWKGKASSAFNVYCSVCGHECGVCFKFCPYCGAIMDGEQAID